MSVIVGLSSNGMPATDRSAVAQLVQPVSGGEGVGAGVGPQQRFGWLTQGSWGGGQLAPPVCTAVSNAVTDTVPVSNRRRSTPGACSCIATMPARAPTLL